MTASTWSSRDSKRKTDGDGDTGEGKTKRIGGTFVVSDTSSRMRPSWIRRTSMVPVSGELKRDEDKACSAGPEFFREGGSGVFRLDV